MAILSGLAADTYDREYGDGVLLKRAASYFAPFRRQLIAIAGLVILFSITGSLFPIFISSGIEMLRTNAPDAQLIAVLAAFFTAATVDYFLFRFRRRLITRVIADVISQMRKDAFQAAVSRDLAFYDENKSGKIVSRITSDTNDLGQVIILSSDLINQMLEFGILLFVLLSIDVRLTLVLLVAIPVVVAVALMFRHFARIVTRQGSRSQAVVNDNIQESVTGISVAKNFRREAMIYDEFRVVNEQSYGINLRRGVVLALVFPTLNALAGLAIAAVVYIGGTFAIAGTLSLATWFLFVQSVDRFWFPFINLSSLWSQIQQGLSALERIFALIDADNTVNQTDARPAPSPMRGEIEFDHVVFEYKSGDRVLDDFSLTIKPGESLAFVGHTGAGKSTIAKLIARFYEFQGGSICVDGADIRTLDLESYRAKLGMVPQAPFLFGGTIMDNIRYARPEATDAEIAEIAHSIGGGEWLETLPDGLNTDVGERGARLSMGQRQLVSLLRVLVQQPAIFILDEATASIDPFTEMQIQEALDLILARSTSILIAHRLSTVRSADRIVVLKEGAIIEQGDHRSLIEQGGHYAELYNTYFRHQSIDYIEHARERLALEPT